MDQKDWLGEKFEENRGRLKGVAYRMLGSASEADDAVQEAWLRLSRTDASGVENLGGWLTTVVGRVCLDMLRSRKTRHEESLAEYGAEAPASQVHGIDPEQEALLADSIGLALLVVLEKLTPAERVAFVLHDMFDVPFEEIGAIVGRSSTATRQLASRARRRVQGSSNVPEINLGRQQRVVDAFLTASRAGNFEALLGVLDPDIVVRADSVAVKMGAQAEVRGSDAALKTFIGRARGARPALINGTAGLAWVHEGQLRVVFNFTILDDKVVGIDLIADPETISQMELTIPEN